MDDKRLKFISEAAVEYLGTQILDKLADSSKEATKTFDGFYERLKYQRDFDLISEEEYYSRLEYLRDTYFEKGTDNWVKYTQQVYAYEKKLLEEEKKEYSAVYDDIAKYAINKLDEIMKKQKKLADNLNSFGGFYNVNTVHMNGFTDHYYSLHDLSADILAIEQYSKDMTRIKERADRLTVDKDASQYLLDQIKGMKTEDALQFMSALLYANDDTFSKYIGQAFKKYNLSQTVSKEQYQTDFRKGVEDSYSYMAEQLREIGVEIPKEFSVSGSVSAKNFGEAFTLELDGQLEKIRGIIDEFNTEIGGLAMTGGNTYNTTNTSYNISSAGGNDTVEQIRRYETVKRLAGIK